MCAKLLLLLLLLTSIPQQFARGGHSGAVYNEHMNNQICTEAASFPGESSASMRLRPDLCCLSESYSNNFNSPMFNDNLSMTKKYYPFKKVYKSTNTFLSHSNEFDAM